MRDPAPLMPFPNELLFLVIGHVDNASTLFSMLTVSRDAFLLAAAALYQKPLWPELSDKGGNKLIDWVLTLSPTEDDNTEMLRQIRGITSETRHGTRPRLAYLDFITTVRWERISWWGCLNGWRDSGDTRRPRVGQLPGLRGWMVRSHLTWAICGHRLEKIQALGIQSSDLARYTALASRLKIISTIYIHFEPQDIFGIVCDNVTQLLQTVGQYHGTHRIQACHLSENVLDHGWHAFSTYDAGIASLLRLSALLLPDPSAPKIPCSDGTVIVLDRPLDRHLGELNFMTWIYDTVRHRYRDLSEGRFLQRCRMRSHLMVTLGLHSLNIFEWAKDEARMRDRLGNKMIPPVPVLHLQCMLNNQRHPPSDLQDVEDALDGFASTLTKVELSLYSNHPNAPRVWRLGEISRTLPRLQSIVIEAGATLVIHPSLWSHCPGLELLIIKAIHWPTSDDAEGEDGDHSWLWPIHHLANLKDLELYGTVASLFHPGSFRHMPRLERITLRGMREPEWMVRDSSLSLAHRWRSSWNWNLPSLTVLDMEIDVFKHSFDFQLLRNCTRLRTMQIVGCGPDDIPYPLRVKPETDYDNHNSENDVYPWLRTLTLRGAWTATLGELSYLYQHMLPGLTDLRLGSQFKLVDCSDRQWFEATRTHPCCTLIAAASLPLTVSLEDLGMVPHWDKNVHSRSYHFADDAYGYLPLDQPL